jgi:hypothetical protein
LLAGEAQAGEAGGSGGLAGERVQHALHVIPIAVVAPLTRTSQGRFSPRGCDGCPGKPQEERGMHGRASSSSTAQERLQGGLESGPGSGDCCGPSPSGRSTQPRRRLAMAGHPILPGVRDEDQGTLVVDGNQPPVRLRQDSVPGQAAGQGGGRGGSEHLAHGELVGLASAPAGKDFLARLVAGGGPSSGNRERLESERQLSRSLIEEERGRPGTCPSLSCGPIGGTPPEYGSAPFLTLCYPTAVSTGWAVRDATSALAVLTARERRAIPTQAATTIHRAAGSATASATKPIRGGPATNPR